MTKTRRFRDLAIGQAFEFDSIVSFPNSGMATGPWIKTSARRYERISDGMQCRVGSINTGVVGCSHCGSVTHPAGCCAQDGHGG